MYNYIITKTMKRIYVNSFALVRIFLFAAMLCTILHSCGVNQPKEYLNLKMSCDTILKNSKNYWCLQTRAAYVNPDGTNTVRTTVIQFNYDAIKNPQYAPNGLIMLPSDCIKHRIDSVFNSDNQLISLAGYHYIGPTVDTIFNIHGYEVKLNWPKNEDGWKTDGSQNNWSYNESGLVSEYRCNSFVYKWEYDETGRKLKEINFNITDGKESFYNMREYTYYPSGRLMEEISYDNSDSITPISKFLYSYDYDDNGNCLCEIKVCSGNPTSKKDPIEKIEYTYGHERELLSKTIHYSKTMMGEWLFACSYYYQYDADGRLIYEKDYFGNVEGVLDTNCIEEKFFKYDDHGRLISESVSDRWDSDDNYITENSFMYDDINRSITKTHRFFKNDSLRSEPSIEFRVGF